MAKQGYKRFRGEHWFETLVSEAKRLYQTGTRELTQERVADLVRQTGVVVPTDLPLKDLTYAVKRRVVYLTTPSYLKKHSLFGVFVSEADLQKTVGQVEADIRLRIPDDNMFRQTMSSIAGLLPAMRSVFSQQPDSGLVNTFDPKSVRLKYLALHELEKVGEFIDQDESGRLAKSARTYLSRVKGLSKKLFGEIQDLLGEDHSIPAAIKNEIKTTVSKHHSKHVRRVIKLAGVRDMNDLLSEEGQRKIANVAYEGKVPPLVFNKARCGLRTIWEKHQTPIPMIFEDQRKDEFFPIEKYNDLFRFEQKLKLAFKPKVKRPITFVLRSLFAANNITSVEQLGYIRPSDFVIALHWLTVNRRGIGPYSSIRTVVKVLLAPSVFETVFRKGKESFEEFCSRVSSLDFPKEFELDGFSVFEYERVFYGGKIDWHLFFEKFGTRCKSAATCYRAALHAKRRRHARPEFFSLMIDHVMKVGYGEVVKSSLKKEFVTGPDGKKRSGGILTKKKYSRREKREVQLLAAFAFQINMTIRFLSESPKLVRLSAKPSDFESETVPSCLYWNEPIASTKEPLSAGRFEMFIHERDRKSGYSYLSPSSTILDAILNRYFEVCDIKINAPLFPGLASAYTGYMKQQFIKLFGHFVTFEEFFMEGRSECLTAHHCRRILRRLISLKYKGIDAKLVATIALGHSPKRDADDSSQKKTYDFELHDSLQVIDTLWRIKNGDFENDDQKRANASEQREKDLKHQVEALSGKLHDVHATGKETLATATATKQILNENLSARSNLISLFQYLSEKHPEILLSFQQQGSEVKKIGS
jgi:hypothetical protein